MVKLEAYVPNLPIHEDRLHVANGTLFLNGEFTEHKEFCRNRLPVKYIPMLRSLMPGCIFYRNFGERGCAALAGISRLLPAPHQPRPDHDCC